MKLDEYKRPIFDYKDLSEFYYKGLDITDSMFEDSDELQKHNENCKINDYELATIYNPNDIFTDFHKENQRKWLIDIDVDIEKILYERCRTEVDRILVEYELTLFKKNDIMDILKMIHVVVETMKHNNILWGVGRGSSVASMCLFLLDVHMVDPAKYDLDIHEFIK